MTKTECISILIDTIYYKINFSDYMNWRSIKFHYYAEHIFLANIYVIAVCCIIHLHKLLVGNMINILINMGREDMKHEYHI